MHLKSTKQEYDDEIEESSSIHNMIDLKKILSQLWNLNNQINNDDGTENNEAMNEEDGEYFKKNSKRLMLYRYG